MKETKMTNQMRDYDLSFKKTIVSVCRFFGFYSVSKDGIMYDFNSEREMNEFLKNKNIEL